jgi:hypothetical protein
VEDREPLADTDELQAQVLLSNSGESLLRTADPPGEDAEAQLLKDVATLHAEMKQLESGVEDLQEWKDLQEAREAQVSKPSRLYIGLTGVGESCQPLEVGRIEGDVTVSDCKRKCDELNGCKGFSYERYNAERHSLCILRGETCNRPPGPCDFIDTVCFWNLKTVLPTHCPADMPEHDPYWAQASEDNAAHHDLARCDHETCTGTFNNWKRLTTLRKLINATDILMRRQQVDYTLVSGTLIGQQRCGDIIPWDADADVQVLDSDWNKLDVLFEGPPNEDPNSGVVGDRKISLGFIGYPQFFLFSAFKCIPWRLVDSETGFYVDVFSPVQVAGSQSTMSRRPIYTGEVACNYKEDYASWPSTYWQHCQWDHCDETPTDVIWPSKRCKFADFEVNCPTDNVAYLNYIYPEASVPDKITRNEP